MFGNSHIAKPLSTKTVSRNTSNLSTITKATNFHQINPLLLISNAPEKLWFVFEAVYTYRTILKSSAILGQLPRILIIISNEVAVGLL